MEQNPEVARGTAKNSQTSFWDDLAIQLNALGPPSKSGKEWLRVSIFLHSGFENILVKIFLCCNHICVAGLDRKKIQH